MNIIKEENEKNKNMRSTFEYRINGFDMPNYLTEILISGYTDTFLPMSIFKERSTYIFLYDLCNFEKINAKEMNNNQKLNLIKSIIEISEKNNNYLIPDSGYEVNLNTIYFNNNNSEKTKIRLLYYPDLKNTPIWEKIKKLAIEIFKEESIGKESINRGSVNKDDLLNGLFSVIESRNANKVNRYIDKKLIRLEKK